MSERIGELSHRIDERAKQSTVLPVIQARIASRAAHLSKLAIQQLQVAGVGNDGSGFDQEAELDSFIKALQEAEDAMIAAEQPGLLRRMLSAMWVNARLAAAQDGLEKSYRDLATAIRTSAQSRGDPVNLPAYTLVEETTILPATGLALFKPNWSDVELLKSITTRRSLDQSSSWASVFTAKVAGIQGTVMVKTYPGKRHDALEKLRKDLVLLNLFQSDVTPNVLSFSAENSHTPFIVLSGGVAVPFGDYLRKICEAMPSQAPQKAWNLVWKRSLMTQDLELKVHKIADILRVAPFLHTHVNPEGLWAMIQPESLVVAENARLITDIPSSAVPERRSLPTFHPLDVDLNEVLRSYFQHDLGLRPLRTLDIYPSMLKFVDRSNPNRPPPPPVISKYYFMIHPDPGGTLMQQGSFPGDFGRFARGAKGDFEFVHLTNVLKTIEVRLPNGAPKDQMRVENVTRHLIRASFPYGLAAIRTYGKVLNLYLRVPEPRGYQGKHGYRLAKEHRVPPWAWAIGAVANCRLSLPIDFDTRSCYLFLQPHSDDQRSRAYWTFDPLPNFGAQIPAELEGYWYTQLEEIDFEAIPQNPSRPLDRNSHQTRKSEKDEVAVQPSGTEYSRAEEFINLRRSNGSSSIAERKFQETRLADLH
ncbi:hypothetical protein FS837_000958 [Tulasnella sp. UAMH 9824]|nr:hypothetical protein FS837_000958 [Tulasnella sp. UAMH 9824]